MTFDSIQVFVVASWLFFLIIIKKMCKEIKVEMGGWWLTLSTAIVVRRFLKLFLNNGGRKRCNKDVPKMKAYAW